MRGRETIHSVIYFFIQKHLVDHLSRVKPRKGNLLIFFLYQSYSKTPLSIPSVVCHIPILQTGSLRPRVSRICLVWHTDPCAELDPCVHRPAATRPAAPLQCPCGMRTSATQAARHTGSRALTPGFPPLAGSGHRKQHCPQRCWVCYYLDL